LETLKILDGYDVKAMGLNTVEFLHHFIEAEKLAHLDNYRYNGDPAFVDVPVERLVSEGHARELRARINPDKAIEVEVWSEYPAGKKTEARLSEGASVTFVEEGPSTTHAVVVDRDGNAVSMTNTHGTFYGAGFIIGKTGMLAANGMDWFDIEKNPYTNETSPNRIEPGKRNRWTLSPVMVFKDGRPFIVIGGCGSEATMVGITLPILHMIEFGLDIQDALYVPRVRWGDVMHYSGGTDVWVERSWIGRTISEEIVEGLAAKGHKVVPEETAHANPFAGYTNGVVIDPETGALMGGCEFRPGFLGGYTRDFAAGF
jgi:gamma-glutamyltranspeptidase/glutathione hydrolase